MAQIPPGQFRNLFNQRPVDPAVMNAAGHLLIQQKHYAAAYHILKAANELQEPCCEETLLQLGLAQVQLAATTGDWAWLTRAKEKFADALSQYPDSAQAHKCLGIAYLEAGETREARLLLEQSLAIQNDQDDAWFSLAQCEFLDANWADAWAALDRFSRARHAELNSGIPYRTTERAQLLVRGKGGLGDEIMLASIIPDMLADGLEFSLMCEPRLKGLFGRAFPTIQILDRPEAVAAPQAREVSIVGLAPTYQAECFLSHFGGLYRADSQQFPRTPYLTADPERRAHWRQILDTLPGRKVGIAWAGGPALNWSRRSLTVEDLVPLMGDIPNVTWVSLEYLDPTPAIDELARHGIKVVELPSATRAGVDYDETAALLAELDVVVSVTTAVVHLCGAIGKRAHVLVPRVPRWWYGLEGQDHTWYGALVQHRQDSQGRWPIQAVRAALLADLDGPDSDLAFINDLRSMGIPEAPR